jgi:NADH-quinone oxidoreductase subunit K
LIASIEFYLYLVVFLLCLGLYGALTAKQPIKLLICIELMMNAIHLNMIVFSRFFEHRISQTLAIFSITLTVLELAIGLSLLLLWYRVRKKQYHG